MVEKFKVWVRPKLTLCSITVSDSLKSPSNLKSKFLDTYFQFITSYNGKILQGLFMN